MDINGLKMGAKKMSDRFLRWKAVRPIIGDVGRTTIWRWMREGSFPKSRRIGKSATAWLESEIQEWIRNRSAME
jgi:prophage regulatory protein